MLRDFKGRANDVSITRMSRQLASEADGEQESDEASGWARVVRRRREKSGMGLVLVGDDTLMLGLRC